MDTIRNLKLKNLPHPSHRPDIARYHFHVFGPLKEALPDRRIGSDEEVHEAMHTCLRVQPNTSSDGMRKFEHRYRKCFKLQGD